MGQVKEGLEDLLKAGFIRAIDYPEWLANIVVVPKKNGKIRLCIDFRDLNKATPKDDYPLPNIDLLVDSTAGHSMFSFMDGYSGYNQIRLAPQDQPKTSFTTPWGTFCYTVMPFGLKNAGATYQRAMSAIFHDQIHTIMDAYVDDLLVKSKIREDHIKILTQVFDRLIQYKLRLNPQKCVFGVESRKLLGFMVSHRGIEIDPAKAKAIIDMPPPKTLTELRSLQGRIQSIRRFISNLAMRCEPFNHLLRKGVKFEWGQECQNSFERIKAYLLNPPVLKPPVLGKPLLLYITVKESACGGFLAQYEEGNRIEHAIYYVSKTFVQHEKNYSLMEKSCLALVWMCQKLRHYLLSTEVKILSKLNPIKYILDQPFLAGRIAKWQVLLIQYDLEYISQKSIKGQAIADQLADFPLSEELKTDDSFPDETVSNIELPLWTLYFDGSKSTIGAGIGILIVSPEKEMIPFSLKLNFTCTHNMAEYEALIQGLKTLVQFKVSRVHVYGDSMLIINQVNREWQVKDEKLIPYQAIALSLVDKFEECKISHIKREHNPIADGLASLGSAITFRPGDLIRSFEIGKLEQPAYIPALELNLTEETETPWYGHIQDFLLTGSYPADMTRKQRKTLQRMSSRFLLLAGILYKRGFHNEYLRCVDQKEATQIVKEAHDGICGGHVGHQTLSRQILRAGYYWPTLQKDCQAYVRRCIKCQIHAPAIHAPAAYLHSVSSPWPFSMWAFDVVGPINPSASNGHKYFLAATDYFTKWVEAITLRTVEARHVVSFIRKNLLCRFGIPHDIVSDNGTHFKNERMRELCTKFNIHHHFSAPYYPQGNGQAEATNKILIRVLERTVETGRDWHEKIFDALWAYRTTIRTPTNATPAELVYGTEIVVPLHIQRPTMKFAALIDLPLNKYKRNRLAQLDLLDEKRLQAAEHAEAYRQRVARHYAKSVIARKFKVNDLVIRFSPPIRRAKGKWAPNWEGPYVIREVLPHDSYKLVDAHGAEIPDPINALHLKKFYA
ncbi:unnamed protein product [Victoria cruziana]